MQGFREESLDAISKTGVYTTNEKAMEKWARDNAGIVNPMIKRALQFGLANYVSSFAGEGASRIVGDVLGFAFEQTVEKGLQPKDNR